MKVFMVSCLVVTAALAACGAKVTVDGKLGAGGLGAGGLGAGGAPAACPAVPMDADVMNLVGKPCATAAEVCSSNDGCGGCSITCTGGTWTATSGQLCNFAGPGSTC